MIFDPSNKYFYLAIYGAYILGLSIITFILYFIDKRKAIKGKWRIPEKVLLLSSFLGGALGGYLSMIIFRHKTTKEHWYFTFVNILSILLHIGGGILIYIFLVK